LDVTALIKSLNEHHEKEKIVSVINLLAHEFARSRNVHHRKGGLIGLAAAAIGLGTDIDPYLNHLIPQVLECFDDPESRVCYYACESLYNISKVARTNVLRFFNQIFDGLCKLFAHVDVDVKNGANLLDRLIKDIVTETETFDIESFIPLLQKHIRRTKPYIRQLLVGWITVLDAVPDINMLDYLPDFLDGLFNMVSVLLASSIAPSTPPFATLHNGTPMTTATVLTHSPVPPAAERRQPRDQAGSRQCAGRLPEGDQGG
jgi:vacuole morphology and inheritance protein 14